MKKQPIHTSEERKLKFAEAGILFVLVLAITVFVGIRMAGQGGAEIAADTTAPAVAEHVTPDEASPVTVADNTGSPAAADIAVPVAGSDQEPVAVTPPRVVTYAMAEETYRSGDYAAAMDLFNTYTAGHPDNAWGHYMLGLSAWKAADTEAADEAFNVALQLKPDHLKSLINSARVLIDLERVDEARTRIDAALRLAPDDVAANRVASRIAHNAGRLDVAADGYLKVLQVEQDDVWSLNNLGLIRIEQERFADALAPLAKAALLNPALACVQNNLGVALERTGHYGAAGEAYAAALTADADYAKADLSLARVGGLTEADDLVAIDLAALAAGFDAAPVPTFAAAAAEADTAVGVKSGDLAVAANLGTQTDRNDPEHDGPQDR